MGLDLRRSGAFLLCAVHRNGDGAAHPARAPRGRLRAGHSAAAELRNAAGGGDFGAGGQGATRGIAATR